MKVRVAPTKPPFSRMPRTARDSVSLWPKVPTPVTAPSR